MKYIVTFCHTSQINYSKPEVLGIFDSRESAKNALILDMKFQNKKFRNDSEIILDYNNYSLHTRDESFRMDWNICDLEK